MSEQPKRPKLLSDEDRRDVASQLAEMLARNGHIETGDIRNTVEDIMRCRRASYYDGYQLAKALDRQCYWDCDLSIAEDLDAWSSLYEERLRERQHEWAASADLGEPLAPGTRVKVRWGGADHTGEIKEVYRYGPAQYVVGIDNRDNKGGGAVVNFEDVTLVAEPAEAAQ